jgi:hypothetical protein
MEEEPMTPETRLNSVVLGVTVSVIFGVLTFILPNVQGLTTAPYLIPAVTWLIALLASVGTYKSAASYFAKFAQKVSFVERWLLGGAYIKGTWVGAYREENGVIRYIVEHHEQTLSSLIVRGWAYTDQGLEHASWCSDAASINLEKGILIYEYGCDLLKRSDRGIGVFNFVRDSPDSAPTHIKGYSADLTDGIRTPSREKKLSSSFLHPDQAFHEAMKYAAEAAV